MGIKASLNMRSELIIHVGSVGGGVGGGGEGRVGCRVAGGVGCGTKLGLTKTSPAVAATRSYGIHCAQQYPTNEFV